jgi:RHS repeat-associated protein
MAGGYGRITLHRVLSPRVRIRVVGLLVVVSAFAAPSIARATEPLPSACAVNATPKACIEAALTAGFAEEEIAVNEYGDFFWGSSGAQAYSTGTNDEFDVYENGATVEQGNVFRANVASGGALTIYVGVHNSTLSGIEAPSDQALSCDYTNKACYGDANHYYGNPGPAEAPANTVLPNISGTAEAGVTLTASTGTWTGSPVPSYTYQWKSCNSLGEGCMNISGATGSSYELTEAEVGGTVVVSVTASNSAGSVSAASSATAVVAPAATRLPLPTACAVNATPKACIEAALTAGFAEEEIAVNEYGDFFWGSSGPQAFSTGTNDEFDVYENGATVEQGNVFRANVASGGALTIYVGVHNGTLSGIEAPSDQALTCDYTNKACYGDANHYYGYATAPVNTAAPAVVGASEVGTTLNASTGTWTGTPIPSYTYQWERCSHLGAGCTNISGATAASFELTTADASHTVAVRVTASNSAGSASASSPVTAVVAPAGTRHGVPSACVVNGTPEDCVAAALSSGFSEGEIVVDEFGDFFWGVSGTQAYSTGTDDEFDVFENGLEVEEGRMFRASVGSDGTLTIYLALHNATVSTTEAPSDQALSCDYPNKACSGDATHYVHLGGVLELAPLAAGTVTVAGHGSGLVSSLASAEIEVTPAGTNEWEALCGPLLAGAESEFGCSWNTSSGGFPDGKYLLRAALSTTSSPPVVSTTATIATVVDNTAPTGALSAPAHDVGGFPTITGTASDGGSGIQTWQLEISPEEVSEWASACPAQSVQSGAGSYSCVLDTTAHADGSYRLRAVVTDAAGNQYITASAALQIDNSTLGGTLTSLAPYVGGTVTLAGTATSTGVAIASWTVQSAPAGTSSWSTACSATTAISGTEYGCEFGTSTVTDGEYQLREITSDSAGNSYTSAAELTTVDNTPPTGSLDGVPARVTGEVAIDGFAHDTGSGVASWELQVAPTGSEAFEQACSPESSLLSGFIYSCVLDTTALASGTYDLRAVITDNLGNVHTTPVVPTTVDNTALSLTMAPTMSGEAVDGRALRATSGIWSGGGTIAFSYQWQRCNSSGESCEDVEGATGSGYPVGPSDVGKTLRVVVTASNGVEATSSASSVSGLVEADALANVSAPTVSGRPIAEASLNASPGTWRGAKPIAFAYQWQRCNSLGESCMNIAGATKRDYRVGAEDVASTMRVVVTASNEEGSASADSSPTGAVAPVAGSTGIRYLYDSAGRLDVVDDPSQGAAIYHWDADGNLTSVDRQSNTTLSVLGVTPAHAWPGTVVDITGTAFDPEAANDEVSFNGAEATVTKATSTDLLVVVPEGATPGAISVTVGEHSAESPSAFIEAASFAFHGSRRAFAPSSASTIGSAPAQSPSALARPNSATAPASSPGSQPLPVAKSTHDAGSPNVHRRQTCGSRGRSARCAATRKHRRRGARRAGKARSRCTTIKSVGRHRPLARCARVKHRPLQQRHRPSGVSKRRAPAPNYGDSGSSSPTRSTDAPANASAYRSPYPLTWLPSVKNQRGGNWISGRAPSPWTKLPPLRAKRGLTSLSGQALGIDGTPVPHVELELQGTAEHTRTDETGRFLLRGVPAGHQELVIEGGRADAGGRRFGRFTVGVDLSAGKLNTLGYTIWMTPLDPQGDTTVKAPSEHETVLTNPRIPGLEVRLPAGTVIRSAAGKTVKHLNLTAIPVDRPPFPLPFVTGIPTYFTVQPGGAYLSEGARILYPNWGHLPRGQRVEFWNYDPADRGWYVYGKGSVSKDGKQLVPDPGVRVWEFTGAMVSSSNGPPGSGPNSGTGSPGGDPVDLGTGLFVWKHTDLEIPDTAMPVSLTHTYRPGDENSYSFGVGTESYLDLHLWSSENYKTAYLVLEDGGKIRFDRTSSGTGFTDAIYKASGTPGRWQGAVLEWFTPEGGWVLRRRDGMKFYFPDYDPVRAIEDRNGNRITLVREGGGDGPAVQIVGPHGHTIDLTHDGSNRITGASDGKQAVAYRYDSTGRLATFTDPRGGITRYAYDSANEMTSVTDARGNVLVSNKYDSSGRVVSQNVGGKGTYTFKRLPVCSGCEAEGTSAVQVTSPTNHTREVHFKHFMPSSEIIDPGPTEDWKNYTRDVSGNVTKIASSSGDRSMSYDAEGDLTSVRRESSSLEPLTTRYAYNSLLEPTSMTDPLGRTTRYRYDSNGNLIGVTDPMGHSTTFERDGQGEVTAVIEPEGEFTDYGLENGAVTSVTNALGAQVQYVNDSIGRPTRVRDGEGNVSRTVWNDANEITSETDPAGDKTSYGYDADGDLTSITDPRGHTQSGTYDSLDHLDSWTDALGKTTDYEYDPVGNLASVVDANGKTRSFAYDAHDRLSSASYGASGGGSPSSTVTYSYDSAGDLSAVVDSRAGTWSLSHDAYHRLTEEAGPNGSLQHTYDADGEQQTLSVNGEEAGAYTYDADGQLTGISTPNGSVAVSYNGDGLRTQTQLPNEDVERYSYDAAAQLTGVDFVSGGERLGDLRFGRDALGRVTSLTGSEARTSLPEPVSETSYNAANELTSREGNELSYDEDGNLLADGSSSYAWNDRGQLTGVTAGESTSTYAYDPFGRRLSKVLGTEETSFLYDAQNVVRETTGGVTASLINGPGLDERFARTLGASTSSYLTNGPGGNGEGDAPTGPGATASPGGAGLVGGGALDGRSGNRGPVPTTVALANGTGEPTVSYTYEPFGSATGSEPSTNPFGFTGREAESNGLQFNRARYYSPTEARFISRDPLGIEGSGQNLYGYAGEDPMNRSDATGLTYEPTETVPRGEGEREKEIQNEEAGLPAKSGGPAPSANMAAPKGSGGWKHVACEATSVIPGEKFGHGHDAVCGIDLPPPIPHIPGLIEIGEAIL